jgi:hypothetical protein
MSKTVQTITFTDFMKPAGRYGPDPELYFGFRIEVEAIAAFEGG